MPASRPPDPPDPQPPATNLVALHRTPQAISPRPRRPSEWLDDLLARPGREAQAIVQAMPEQEIYLAVRELGLGDSASLLRLCSPEQVRACLDIDCWQRDQLDSARLEGWIAALLELGPQRVARVIEALDHELLVTYLHRHARVYDLSAEEAVPEEPEGHLYATPDRFFVVELLGDSGPLIERFIENLYAADLDLGRRVMVGARWDMGAETEEAAYRFRSARMADLGYLDYYDALPIYAFLDPRTVRLTEDTAAPLPQGTAGPGLIPTELEGALGDSTFGRALRLLDEAQRDHLVRQLLVLLNQALSADRIDPADLGAARQVMMRAAGYLSMALEILARAPGPGEEQVAATAEGRAVLALRRVSLSRLFRLGYSLTAQLQRLAAVLAGRSLLTLVPGHDPASLLEPPLDEVVRLLVLPRPLYSAQLEGGPAGGRPFRTLAEVARVAAALEDIKALGELLTTGLGVRRDTLAQALAGKSPALGEIRLSDILGTMAANLLPRRPPLCVPLSRADLPALRQAALGLQGPHGAGAEPALTMAAQRAVRETLRGRVRERSVSDEEAAALWTPATERLVDQAMERLGRSLGELPADLGGAELDVLPSLPGLILA